MLFYIYLGYPLLIWLLSRLCPKPVRKGPFHGTCSVVIAAHNEAHHLSRKLTNLVQLEGAYIREILIGSDGSDDGTVQAVRDFISRLAGNNGPEIRLCDFPERRGKAAVLNDLVPQCRGDIVVFMDARQEVKTDAIIHLMENFADPQVGAVSGELIFRPADGSTARGMSAYWQYEKFIRRAEARFNSVPGATGALYAVRKSLFEKLPSQVLLDDVVIPLVIISKGYRCIFCPEACVYDIPSVSSLQESIRKRRTIAGNIQTARLFPQWLLPWCNPAWWQFLSHKIIRLISPWVLLLLLGTSGLLYHYPIPLILFAVQVLFYSIGLIDILVIHNKWCSIPATFIHMNIYILQAVNDVIKGSSHGAWRRTD